MAVPFLRSPFNYDMGVESIESGLECLDPSRTVQDGKEEADINTIVRRFGLTGKLPDSVRLPSYGDFEGVVDYQGALNAVIAAEDGFMRLPAHIRSRFHNDPAALLDFVGNEANRAEAEKLGILVPPPEIVEVPTVPPVENPT